MSNPLSRGTVHVDGAGGSAPSGTIGAAVPSTATPAAVQDNAGNLAYPKLDASGNLLVAVTGAGSGGTSSTDEATYTPTTTAGTPAMAAVDDTSTDTCAEDKVGIVRMTPSRALHMNLRKQDGTELGTSSAPLRIDPTNATAQLVSLSTDQVVAEAGSITVQAITVQGAGGGAVPMPVSLDASSAADLASVASSTGLINNAIKIEDAVSGNGESGMSILVIRKDTPGNLSGTDGDYEFPQMAAGRLWVSAKIDTALPAGSNAIGILGANSGVDVGDVTINNASGASAVNIQDGGNSITIDATNLDVLLSTRLKPADTLAAVTTVGTITNVVHVDDNAASLTIDSPNLDVALSTRLKPADTLTAVTTVGTITNVVHVDDNAGSLTVDGAVTVSGSVTANAGTNLNTSALALEAGNLASINTKTPALGQALKVASVPVVVASDQVLVQQYQDGATTSPTTGVVGMGVVNDTPESYNGGEVRPFSFTTEGRLRVSTMPANVDHIWQTTFLSGWFSDSLPAADSFPSFY